MPAVPRSSADLVTAIRANPVLQPLHGLVVTLGDFRVKRVHVFRARARLAEIKAAAAAALSTKRRRMTRVIVY